MLERRRTFRLLYPDVLGAVTGGTRIPMEHVQIAFGVFPRHAFINQPFEAVIILQSMVNQPLQIKIAMRLPTTDKKDAPAVIDTPKPQINMTMQPGEVGILRMPIIAKPPTQPGKEFPVRVAVRYRVPDEVEFVRPPAGGAPPSVLEVSPFKLQALRDIEFKAHTWNESAEIITSYFDLAPHRLPQVPELPKPRYEVLWSHEYMPQEMVLAKSQLNLARQLSNSGIYSSSYNAFLEVVSDRFAERELPLHPGEAMAIAKMMAYTLDEAPKLEQVVDIEETRWFLSLCQLLAAQPELAELDRNEVFARYLFNDVLYEAILMGFHIIQHKVNEDLGDDGERRNYANRVLAWMAGRGFGDLNYVYLPLVLGGLSISRLVRSKIGENPWDIVDALTEAMQGRVRLADGETIIVFDMLNEMLSQAAMALRSQRIVRG
jgi:hypothetical protein